MKLTSAPPQRRSADLRRYHLRRLYKAEVVLGGRGGGDLRFPGAEVVGVYAGPRRHTLTTESEDLVTPNDIAEVLENCARLIRLGVQQGDPTYNEKAYWRARDALTDLEAHIDPAWLASYSPPVGPDRRPTPMTARISDKTGPAFGEWLITQAHRRDPVGHLATEVAAIGPQVRTWDISRLRRDLDDRGAAPEAYDAFDRATREYLFLA